jgi:hypothetical protein
MKKFAVTLCLFASLTSACGGGGGSKDAASPESVTSANPDSPRAKTATKVLAAIKEGAADDAQRGRLAASSFSEDDFAMPKSLRKALAAVSGNEVDASMVATILAMALQQDDQADAIERICGESSKSFFGKILKTPSADRAKFSIDHCKLQSLVSGQDLSKLNYTSILLAGAVTDLSKRSGQSSPDELALAAVLVHLHRLDEKP